MKNWLIGKDPAAGKDWRQEEKGTTEDEMADGIINLMDMSLSKFQETEMDREAWHAAVMGLQRDRQDWATKLNWTELETKEPNTENYKTLMKEIENDINRCKEI